MGTMGHHQDTAAAHHLRRTSQAKPGSGSRRIFSARFKLRVLDSYRKDSDCRGNQRATARKYGIHRRQIQKWLQTENNLRRSAESEGGGDEKRISSTEEEGAALNPTRPTRQPDDAAPTTTTTTTTPTPPPPPHHHQQPSSSDEEEEEEYEDNLSSDNSESSLYEQERALDFTCAALSKRRFFSDSFKLQVVDAFYCDSEVKGNQRATARKYGVHRRQVQKWIEDQSSLRAADTCLDLSNKKRKCEESRCGDNISPSPPPPKKPAYEELVPIASVEQPSSVQETALCLVKHRESPAEERVSSSVQESGYTLYRPYEDLVTITGCCQGCDRSSWSPPTSRYLPYYGLIDASYVAECLSHDMLYYRQTVHDVALYAPMYS